MRRVGALLVASAMAVAQAKAVQNPARDTPAQTGTGVIRGRITDAGGRPVRKVRVRVSSAELKLTRFAVTDASGRYEVKALPAGTYSALGIKLGYISTPYGRTRPNGPAKPITVATGQVVENIDFAIWRGGVFTGRVVDEFGEPVASAEVRLLRYVYVQGSRQLTNAAGLRMTNDLGEFRLFGVQPGQYYLAVHISQNETADRFGYVQTYYPGVVSVAEAQPLTIAQDQTIGPLSITLSPFRSARLSGTVMDSNGRPMANAWVMASLRESGGSDPGNGSQVNPDGTFSIGGLAPGEYVLRATNRLPAPAGKEVAAMAVTVGGDDISDLHLVAVKPSTLTGKVVLDRPATAQLKASEVRVSVTAAKPEDGQLTAVGMPTMVLKDDFTFEVESGPGHVLVHTVIQNAGWAVKTVRLNDTDVTEAGIDVFPNQPVAGIEVEVTSRLSELSGVVTDANDQPTGDAWVIVFKGPTPARFVKVGHAGFDSRFKIRLLPGSYYVAAIDRVEPGEWTDSDFLNRLRRDAVQFSIDEDEQKKLDLKIVAVGS